ncbi:YgjV family protein [Actinotalea sp. M2MS4P-6]|uniref:YgjV family protein n=1 Tax=Actinotalea sp. M2MS4P-6 TaxID=2983762 RepID=UPI0021E4CCF0|nr:YgjV family protein [Actinotalea sp. M2MS4P-6]MCV2393406.1 YgjV family protein [Actinotalea sp. M2MS4P-6]
MPWLEIIGWAGSALLVLSLLQTRLMRLRVLNSVACVVLIGYNAVLGVWPMVAMNVVLVAINLWAIARLLRERHDARVYDAVTMQLDEPFLHHLLERHEGDIRRFNPDLAEVPAADLAARADHAFVVSTSDHVVGVVLSAVGDDAGEQQVLLDYVLPAYRDFTPGEFVFRADGPFAALGTTTVVASPGMASSESYLRAVGFVERDGRRVLDLAPSL